MLTELCNMTLGLIVDSLRGMVRDFLEYVYRSPVVLSGYGSRYAIARIFSLTSRKLAMAGTTAVIFLLSRTFLSADA